MKQVRIEAIKLRKQGKSYNEISRELGVAKSTLSSWLKDIQLTKVAQDRLQSRVHQGVQNGLIKRNKLQTKFARARAQQSQRTAAVQIGSLSHRELLLVGTALYWGEGYKKLQVKNGREVTSHQISFVNADPEMIKLFLRFLRECLDVSDSDIRLAMRLYKHINEGAAKMYWRHVTNIPSDQFQKTTYLISGASKRRRPKDSLPYGTLQIAVYSTERFHHILGLIQGLKKSL